MRHTVDKSTEEGETLAPEKQWRWALVVALAWGQKTPALALWDGALAM